SGHQGRVDEMGGSAPGAAGPVMQPEPQRVDGEIGSETLRTSGKVHAFSAVIGKEIFGARRPTRCQRNFYAGARSTAEARHHEMIFDRPGGGRAADRCAGNLRTGELIEAVGETAGRVQQ